MSHTVEGIIGPFVMGGVLSCLLAGIVSTQVFQYYSNFPNDRVGYKATVYSLLILNLTNSALSVWTIWDFTVANFGNFKHLAIAPWSFGVAQILFGLSAFMCRSFYAYRVWIISKRKNFYLPIAILLLTLASLGCALGAAVSVLIKKYFSTFADYRVEISVWLGLAMLSDGTITASLVYYLFKSKSGGLHSTNSLINKLIELVVSTNGLSVLTGTITGLLFWLVEEPWHITTNATLIHVYTLSLLVSLNARIELERRLNNPSSTGVESHGLTELNSTTRSTTIKGNGADGVHRKTGRKDLRTALGFGREDIHIDSYDARNRRDGAARSLGEGIQVVTHQTVVTDNGNASTTYLSTPTSVSEKSLHVGYFSNEKEEEASIE
ncbi:DUF6534 domain-containing protein [Sporobolomyces salmoneus]|uniref:DUF6534 domain-containing protein n=1 Tax=Sporobolomyces salmoneus TaxID=183962 RepID=UPI0031714181